MSRCMRHVWSRKTPRDGSTVADTITRQATSSLVALVLDHYEAQPRNDGHPAYRLYAEYRRRRRLAADETGNASSEPGTT